MFEPVLKNGRKELLYGSHMHEVNNSHCSFKQLSCVGCKVLISVRPRRALWEAVDPVSRMQRLFSSRCVVFSQLILIQLLFLCDFLLVLTAEIVQNFIGELKHIWGHGHSQAITRPLELLIKFFCCFNRFLFSIVFQFKLNVRSALRWADVVVVLSAPSSVTTS
ncbi:hypothetical protein YC2023_105610 [Brassica napus]